MMTLKVKDGYTAEEIQIIIYAKQNGMTETKIASELHQTYL